MKKYSFLLAAIALAAFLSGCCCDKVCAADQKTAPAKKMPIYGSWTIADLPAATAKKIKPAPKAGITFEKGKVFGCAGDNRFFGNLKIEGRNLTFSHMGMTRMMGPNARYEGFFMAALNQVTQYAVDGDMKLLDKNGKVLMILKPKPETKEK